MKLHWLSLIYEPRRDGRLSWPAWLTHSGHWTYVNHRLARHRSGKVRQQKTDVITTEPCKHGEGFINLRLMVSTWTLGEARFASRAVSLTRRTVELGNWIRAGSKSSLDAVVTRHRTFGPRTPCRPTTVDCIIKPTYPSIHQQKDRWNKLITWICDFRLEPGDRGATMQFCLRPPLCGDIWIAPSWKLKPLTSQALSPLTH